MALSNLTVTWGLVFQPVAEVALLALLLPVVPARLIHLVSMARTPVKYSSLALAKRLRLWVTRTPFCIPTIRSKRVSRIPRNTPFSRLCSNRCCAKKSSITSPNSRSDALDGCPRALWFIKYVCSNSEQVAGRRCPFYHPRHERTSWWDVPLQARLWIWRDGAKKSLDSLIELSTSPFDCPLASPSRGCSIKIWDVEVDTSVP